MISLLVVLEATLGGTRRHVVDLLLALDPRRYDITFVYSRARADAAFAPALERLRLHGIRLHEVPLRREVRPWQDAMACWHLVRIIKQCRPNVIHLHGAKAGAVGRVAAILGHIGAVVYTPHGGAFHKFEGLGGRIYLWCERMLAAACDTHFIGVSADSCAQIRTQLKPREGRVHLVYNGIARRPDGGMHAENVAGRFIVLYPAVFLEAKGHLRFLDAMRASPTPLNSRIEIWLAGDGPLRSQIENRIRIYGLADRVKLLGFVEAMESLYETCDLVLLPSQDEAFGYVALEAMQHGRLIVASNVGGLREIIQHDENGRFLSETDWQDLAGTLNVYAADPVMIRRLGEAAKRFADTKFSLDEMAAETATVYEQVRRKDCE